MGDIQQAEHFYQQARQLYRDTQGLRSVGFASCLEGLAELFALRGDTELAQLLSKEVVEIRHDSLGAEHPKYAEALNRLGVFHQAAGQYSQAENLFKEALRIRQLKLGDQHPACAQSLGELATLYFMQKDYDRALPLLCDAQQIIEQSLGNSHPTYASILNQRAELCRAKEDYSQAATFYRQALAISRRNLELTAAIQSERQQLSMAQSFRYLLDDFMQLAATCPEHVEAVYREVLAWKGAVTTRQQLIRAAADDPRLAPLVGEYRRLTAQLATLAFGTPEPSRRAAWQARMSELATQREALESQLSQQSVSFRDSQQPTSLEDLQATLPPRTALIDFLEFGTGADRRLGAFVVREGHVMALCVLERTATIERLVTQWRGERDDDFGDSDAAQQAAVELRNVVWLPLEHALQAHPARGSDSPSVAQSTMPDVVLLSPDGVLARFPLSALPGSQPESYLIEEVTLALIPVPRQLPQLTHQLPESDETASTLLAMGDIDYDHRGADAADLMPAQLAPSPVSSDEGNAGLTAPGQHRAARSDQRERFRRLAGMADELARLRERYLAIKSGSGLAYLDGTAASEANFRREAPKSAYVHVTTHGFFAPPELVSAAATGSELDSSLSPADAAVGWDPDLLSGLALAGANLPPELDGDDGILTAAEVAALDLRKCRLVVLSACETGLGKVAGGEGLLGLQRAFQVAGAHALVSSLWKVDDQSTSALMQLFYYNLWERRLTPLAALRDAQLLLLNNPTRIRDFAEARGLALHKPEGPITTGRARTSPRLWGAFMLSGNWR
jgi:CHAT domain-containing protein